MSDKNKIKFNFIRSMKLAFIICPLILFSIYLEMQHKITNLELIMFFMVTTLPLIFIFRNFQKKLIHLNQKQIQDINTTKENQLLLENIMEKLSDPILILDSLNHIVMANKSAHKLLGKKILKQEIATFIQNPALIEAIQESRETGKSENCELKFGAPIERHYLTRIHLFNQDNEQIINAKKYLFLALYDVSTIKRTDKMRVDFVANASHELRTPLSSILGFVETLQGPAKGDDDAHDRFLAIMHDEASRMSRLIEDLLSLSRIERDEHIPPSDSVKLVPLIENVIKVLEPLANDKDMTISFSHVALKEITGDHDQLTQVFQNLIENAVKYGNEKTEIKVACDETETPAPFNTKEVSITIINVGPGIPAKHLPRLMERFYRVDSARSRSLGGTGLGLAIVKHIIQRHRGHIVFESEINVSTKVTISLPI